MRRLTRQLRFGIRLIQAFAQRHLWIIVLGCLSGIFAFIFLSRFLLPSSKKEVRIGLVGRFDESQVPEEITELASLGLTKLLPEGIATSSLAKSWETLGEGKVYKFYLRDDVLWQDGSRVTAKDIAYEFKNAQLQVISDFQIQITLTEPFSALPALVSKPIFKKDMIGIGDYQIAELKRKGRFLEKAKLVPVRNEALPNLVYQFYTTEEAAKIGFKLGKVDILKGIVNVGGLEKWSGVKITPRIHKGRYAAIFFNLKNPKFEEKFFRQALAYAIKKEEGEKRAYGPISPLSWAYNSELKPYGQNLTRAKELLEKTEAENSIKLFAFPSLIAEAEKIKEEWQSLNIEAEVKIINTLPEDFEVLLAVWEIPADPDQYSFWHSTQTKNLTGFANPKVDKFLEEGRKTFDLKERRENYLEFQKTLVEECPAIFLFHPVTYTISR